MGSCPEMRAKESFPRKYLFGKDFYDTARIFNYLRTSSVYLQTLFSGKFCTHSHHTVAQNIPIGLRPLSKSSYVYVSEKWCVQPYRTFSAHNAWHPILGGLTHNAAGRFDVVRVLQAIQGHQQGGEAARRGRPIG